MSDKAKEILGAEQVGVRDLHGIVEKILSVRNDKKPIIDEKREKIATLLSALKSTHVRAREVANRYPDIKTALLGISFNKGEQLLLDAQSLCDEALSRLTRSSITIGVAGMSGQGKSQILRMLTGLGDAQIPTGGGSACTAVQSIVHNSKGQKGVVHFLTESGLLEKKVYPSFGQRTRERPFALGISIPRPATIAEFLLMDLRALVPQDVRDNTANTQAVENWRKVEALQDALKKDNGLIQYLGTGSKDVDFEEISSWLKKDDGETKHNVVDYVEMWTQFDNNLPEGLTVLDLPGLGDPTPGIKEDMLANLKHKTDIVFFLRKASRDGARELWKEEDYSAFDMISSIYPADEVRACDWVQLILNLDRRNEHLNVRNTEALRDSVPRNYIPVVCDCGAVKDVRMMVDSNLNRLVEQAGCIDDICIKKADDAFREALKEISALYDTLRNATGDVVAQESGFDFERHLLAFMAQLRGPFRRDVSPEFRECVEEILSRHLSSATQKFDATYKEFQDSDAFPPEFPVFSKRRLTDEFAAAEGPSGPVEKAVRNQREALLMLLRKQLADCCAELVESYFKSVVEVGFSPNPSLSRIGEANSGQPRDRLSGFLAAVRRSGTFASIEDAIEGLLRFNLSFESTILPVLYSMADLDDFNPDHHSDFQNDTSELASVRDYIANSVHDPGERAVALFNWLRQKSEIILDRITSGGSSSPVASMSAAIANTMLANYDAFSFRFIWGDTTTGEWRRLADRNKASFWKDEFEAAATNSQLARDWDAALRELLNELN